MKTLFDQLSELERQAVASILGFSSTSPGFDVFLREIPAFSAAFTIGDAVNAYLGFMTDHMNRLFRQGSEK